MSSHEAHRDAPIRPGGRLRFSIQYVRPLINGMHFGAVVGAHFGGKYYASPNAAITLRKHGKTGTFSGTWDKLSGSGPFRGTYTC